jgi:hypothetical protein
MCGCGFSATLATTVFHDCNLSSSGFSKFIFEHCFRDANRLAHELARDCFISFSSHLWDDD